MLKKLYKILILPYTVFLLYIMFFSMGRYQIEDHLIRIVPFWSTIAYLDETLYFSVTISIVGGNIVMFIPFGFVGWVFPKLKNLKSLIFNFVSIIIIVEALQYFSRRGVFDIDDIILNTFGVYLGWEICKLLELRFKRLVI